MYRFLKLIAILVFLLYVNKVGLFAQLADTANANKRESFHILYSAQIYRLKGHSYKQIWKMGDDSKDKVQLTNDHKHHDCPVMSPDGKSIAFLSENSEVWVMDNSRKSESRIMTLADPNWVSSILGWDNNSKILYVSGDSIYKINVSSKNIEHFKVGNEVSLAIVRSTYAIANEGIIKVSEDDNIIYTGNGSHPSLSSDGERLAFISGEPGKESLKIVDLPSGKQELYIAVNELLKQAEIDIETVYWSIPISWSSDNSKLLIGGYSGNSTSHYFRYLIFDMDLKQSKYADDGNDAIWSPDGSKIVWSTPRKLQALGKMNLWVSHIVVYNVKTGEMKTLTSGVSLNTAPSWYIK